MKRTDVQGRISLFISFTRVSGLVVFLWSFAVTVLAVENSLSGDTLITRGHASSLIGEVRAKVVIVGDDHEALWVHPELVSDPDHPERIEFRVRPTDRYGKDGHGDYIYFETIDFFETLSPIAKPTSNFWQYVGLRKEHLHPSTAFRVPGLGHTWGCPAVYTDSNIFIQGFTSKATAEGNANQVQTLVVRRDGDTLVPVHISNSRTNSVGRGLYEPHIVGYKGRHYMSVRAEDGRGYLLVSEDKGYSWSEPIPWRWDDGTEIPMNQTMTKLLSHSDGLVLVYTRKRDDNADVFRHRAPLHCADIDLETLQIKRDTEIVVVPNRGLCVGNFWVWPISPEESYIATAEWPRDGRLENGDIWLVKVGWKKPNEDWHVGR